MVGLSILVGGWLLSQEQKLTILVVSLDTTRPDHLTPYGYDKLTTPTLARLAAEGTRFSSARSTTSWTLPSHMSLFTGLPADLHNVTIDFQTLDLGRPTMGQIFKQAGYQTTGIFSAPYLHSRFGFARGMDFYEAATRSPMVYDLPPRQMGSEDRSSQLEFVSHLEVTSTRIRTQALQSFSEARIRPKMFMFLHFFDPHYDYLPPAKFAREFISPTYRGPVNGQGVLAQPDVIHSEMPAADLTQLLAYYDAEIRFVDQNLGEVIQGIEDSGGLGSTIVVITGDHGEEFFEHGKIGHRTSLSEEVLAIPLIFWGPGIIPEGQVIDDDVALYDVLPTLMDYADLPEDPIIYGRSLRPLIEGGALEKRPTHAALTFLHREGPEYYTRHDAIVYDGMKYVRRVRVPWSPDDPMRIDNMPEYEGAELEVFDLRADPGEQTNLFDRRGEDARVRGIISEFEAEQLRQKSAKEAFEPRGFDTPDGFAPSDHQDFMDTLRGLGYVGAINQADPVEPGETLEENPSPQDAEGSGESP